MTQEAEDIKDLAKQEHKTTRDVVLQSIQAKQSQVEYSRIRASLFYSEIFSRQEQIKDTHPNTFQWIFDNSEAKLGRWDSFM